MKLAIDDGVEAKAVQLVPHFVVLRRSFYFKRLQVFFFPSFFSILLILFLFSFFFFYFTPLLSLLSPSSLFPLSLPHIQKKQVILANWVLVWLLQKGAKGVAEAMIHRYIMKGPKDKEATSAIRVLGRFFLFFYLFILFISLFLYFFLYFYFVLYYILSFLFFSFPSPSSFLLPLT